MTQHSQQSRAQHSTILGHFALVKADAEGHFIDYARSAGTFLDVKFVRSIQIGAVCSSEWAVHSLCIPESEHLNYKLIMSGVAHQRLSQVSGVFVRLLTPCMHSFLLQS